MSRAGRRVLVALVAIAVIGVVAPLLAPAEPVPHPARDRTPAGASTWATLLEREGRRVRPRTADLAGGGLRPGEAVILVGEQPSPAGVRVALAHAAAGGRVVAVGSSAAPLAVRLGLRPRQAAPEGVLRRVADRRALPAVGRVEPGPEGRLWAAGAAGRRGRSVLETTTGEVGLVAVRRGRGSVLLVPDPGPLVNAEIARADHAALAVALVGNARTVVIASPGAGGLPARVTLALLLGLGAALALILAAGRLGPPDPSPAAAPPARGAYVDAQVATLRATGDPHAAVAGAREAARDLLARRAGLGPDPSTQALLAAGARLGLPDEEAGAVAGTADDDPRAAGRALARLRAG